MRYILSEQRDDPLFTAANYHKYHEHLKALASRFHANAYTLAASDWWYSFDDPRAPHDGSLISVQMGDVRAKTKSSPQYCSLSVELAAAKRGKSLFGGVECTFCAIHWGKHALTAAWDPKRDDGLFILSFMAGKKTTTHLVRGDFMTAQEATWSTIGMPKALMVRWTST